MEPGVCSDGVEYDDRGIRADGHYASREAMEEGENWKRAECLACGGRIVRARSAYVELIGKRDGSWVSSWGRVPFTLQASDSENIPREDVYALGVVHQSCEQLACERLAAADIKLPRFLLKMRATVGDDVDEPATPDLHLPALAHACPFCGSAEDMSDEHIYPKWFSRWLFTQGAKVSIQERQIKKLDFTAPVCEDCNNRWMSVLENDVQPVLMSMFKSSANPPSRVALDVEQQHRLAFWATKTVYMLDAGDRPEIPRGFLHALANQRRPATSVVIWMTTCDYRMGLRWHRKLLSVRRDGSTESLVIHFAIFNVVFEIFMHFNEGTIEMIDSRASTAWDETLVRIWPPNEQPVMWPLKYGIHSERSWESLLRSMGEDEPIKRWQRDTKGNRVPEADAPATLRN